MARRKLPLLTERSLAQTKADRIEFAAALDAKIPAVSCKPGCASCCSYPVYISILEGMLLYRHLTEKGHWTPSLRAKLKEHDKATHDVVSEVWLLLDMPCPLLDKAKRCSAYAARPFSCRSLYAVSDPKFCKPAAIQDAVFVPRDMWAAKYRKLETDILAQHKVGLIGLTIGKAILLAEKIMTGDADLEHFVRMLLESFVEVRHEV